DHASLSYSWTRQSADAVTENGALMAAVATISASHPLRSAGTRGPLWITDKWLRSFGLSVSAKKPPLSNRSFAWHTAWLETIMPFAAALNVTVLVRTRVVPSGPGDPVGPVGPAGATAPGSPAAPGGPIGPVSPTGPGRPAAPGVPGGPMGPGLPGGPVGPGSPREPTDVSWDLHAPPRRITRPLGFWQSIALAPAVFTATKSPNTREGAISPVAACLRFGRAEGVVSPFAMSASPGLPHMGRRPANTKSVVFFRRRTASSSAEPHQRHPSRDEPFIS